MLLFSKRSREIWLRNVQNFKRLLPGVRIIKLNQDFPTEMLQNLKYLPPVYFQFEVLFEERKKSYLFYEYIVEILKRKNKYKNKSKSKSYLTAEYQSIEIINMLHLKDLYKAQFNHLKDILINEFQYTFAQF